MTSGADTLDLTHTNANVSAKSNDTRASTEYVDHSPMNDGHSSSRLLRLRVIIVHQTWSRT